MPNANIARRGADSEDAAASSCGAVSSLHRRAGDYGGQADNVEPGGRRFSAGGLNIAEPETPARRMEAAMAR